MDEEQVSTLEAFMRNGWVAVGGTGGVRGMCTAMGITPETVYTWWRGENEPRMDSIQEIARTLKVTRAEVVAAIDGFDWMEFRRQRVAEEVEAAVGPLRDLLRDAGLLPEATAPGGGTPSGRPPSGRAA